jgi:hypothetical protein
MEQQQAGVSKKRAVIFLGPSLSQDDARQVLDVEYRRPVQRGDIDELLSDPPDIVGIVDGQFFQNLSVSPKEILRALRAGVTVFGSSSMGALRAVELLPYGMIGVGQIFKLYRSGRVDADDEVAMVFSPSDLRALSVPMVNIRFALRAAAAEGLITQAERRLLLKYSRGLYFPERSYGHLLSLAAGSIDGQRLTALKDYLRHRAPDAKREDALCLLSAVRQRLYAQN